jgi:hypothetical protein
VARAGVGTTDFAVPPDVASPLSTGTGALLAVVVWAT